MSHNLSLLPTEALILDIPGIVLFPRGNLPIYIKEEKHKQLVEAALKAERYIGVVQTNNQEEGKKLFPSGCLGKITTFSESDDGGFLIILSGVCRFKVLHSLESSTPYLRCAVSYDTFSFDLFEEHESETEREKLLTLVKAYMPLNNLPANWDEIQLASQERLITALTMMCPFKPEEKQALLESATLSERTQMITALLEIAFLRNTQPSSYKH